VDQQPAAAGAAEFQQPQMWTSNQQKQEQLRWNRCEQIPQQEQQHSQLTDQQHWHQRAQLVSHQQLPFSQLIQLEIVSAICITDSNMVAKRRLEPRGGGCPEVFGWTELAVVPGGEHRGPHEAR